MSVQRTRLVSRFQDLRPFRRVFGRTFHRSTSSVPSCDVCHDVGNIQAYQAVMNYRREGLLKLRISALTENCSTSSRTLAYFVTEAVLDDDIGVCTKENYAQTMGNHRVRSLYACLVTAYQQLQPHHVLVYLRLEQREIITRIG